MQVEEYTPIFQQWWDDQLQPLLDGDDETNT